MKIDNPMFDQFKDILAKSMEQTSSVAGSLGVDLGTYAVKLVRIEAAKDGIRVLGAAVEKVLDKNYPDALSRALAKAHATADQSAVLSVSGQGVVSRYIELPIMNKTELDSSMKFEIEKYVPFPIADVCSDYAVIHEMKDKAKMSVLIAAAKNEIIQKKCKTAKEVNLGLKAIDLDSLALANFAAEVAGLREKGNCCGIINIGKTAANIDILIEGAPYLSRDIFIGGDDLTKKMVEALEIEYAEAEKLKLNPGKRLEELLSIWDPVLNNLAAEIRVSLDYFEARNNRAVEKIYIVGGTSRMEGIEEYLNRLLSVEIKKLDYAARLKFDAAVDQDDFRANSDLYAVALGLALR